LPACRDQQTSTIQATMEETAFSGSLNAPMEYQIDNLRVAVQATQQAPADERAGVALQALLQASEGRIPSRLRSNLLAYGIAPRLERSPALAKAIGDSMWLFDKTCGRSFEPVATTVAGLGPEQRNRHLWSECRFERFPLLAGEEEFVAASERLGPEPMLAYFLYGYFADRGGPHELELRLLREVAGGLAENDRHAEQDR
jgi:hypothetical protein